MRRSFAIAATLCAALALPARAAAPAACPPAPDDAADDLGPLPHLAAALKSGTTLEILAVGSATMFPPGAVVAPEAARRAPGAAPAQPSQTGFPWQAARALQTAIHGLTVEVTFIGRRGVTAADMLLLVRQELPHKPYRLVLWQTGTVEAGI